MFSSSRTTKTVLLWTVLVAMFVLIDNVKTAEHADRTRIAFSEFLQRLDAGELKGTSVLIVDEYEYLWTEGGRRMLSRGTVTDGIMARMESQGVSFSVERTASSWGPWILGWAPVLILGLILVFLVWNRRRGPAAYLDMDLALKAAEVYLRKDRFMEAVVVCTSLLERNPEDADARVLFARVKKAQGQNIEALAELHQVIATDPEHPAAIELLSEWDAPTPLSDSTH